MRIFLSYASAESAWASRVTDELGAAGMVVILARHDVPLSSSFVQFVNAALENAGYCLLLWSKLASERGWGREEWQFALQRSINEQRGFLFIARIEDVAPPRLLQHRLRVDLFADFAAGMQKLLGIFRSDHAVAQSSGRPVVRSMAKESAAIRGSEIYVTSQLFDCTIPVRVNLQEPTAMAVERFVSDSGLPKQVGYNTTIGFYVKYAYVWNGRRLDPGRSLTAQGVLPGYILSLETRLQPFAATDPISGRLTSTTFRLVDVTTQSKDAKRAGADIPACEARNELLAAIRRAGLVGRHRDRGISAKR